MELTGDILKKSRAKKGYSQQQVADYIGVTKKSYQYYEGNDRNPKVEKVNKLIEYLDIEKETNVPHEKITYLEKRRGIKNSEKADIPVFGSFTTLGNVTVYNDDRMKNEVIAGLPPALFPNCNYAERAKGQSMYPLIMNQALLVGYNGSIQSLTYGEIYIIKTKDGLDTTKYVHPGTDETKIKLKAYNKSVPEQEINREDVVFVCRIHWIINPT
jgi:transcriptional regulator with XRE-family HTH domain